VRLLFDVATELDGTDTAQNAPEHSRYEGRISTDTTQKAPRTLDPPGLAVVRESEALS
jgi:hypothetical protein